MSVFESLHPSLQETLITDFGWNTIRPIQEKAYDAVVSGSDILILAPTAGGKTEAAFLPVIDAVLKQPSGHMSVVYISPLKALINNQIERVIGLVQRAGLEVAVQHGDIVASERFDFSKGEPDILLTTPESLEVLLSRSISREAFRYLRFIIVDEIHAFVETARGVQLKCLIERITRISTVHSVRIGLSATVGNPEDLLDWFSESNRKKELVHVPSPSSKKRIAFHVEADILKVADMVVSIVLGKKVLVFVNSRSLAEKLYVLLSDRVPSLYIHHSAVSTEERKRAEHSFMDSHTGSCVICTSTMELGIDIGDLDLAINYGVPPSVSSFLQRLGRCGRRGKPAEMVFIVKDACELMEAVAIVESALQHRVESLSPYPCVYDVLIQQLMVLVRNRKSVSKKDIVQSLHSLSSFSSIQLNSVEFLVDYLIELQYLISDGSLLMLGTRAEQELGGANWQGLISVLPDTGGYTAVLPDGTIVGMLDARFVAGDTGKIFSFTGKTWCLLQKDEQKHRVIIEPSTVSKGIKRPFWSGTGFESHLSRLVAEACGELIVRGKSLLPLSEENIACLNELLFSLPCKNPHDGIHLRIEPIVDNIWDVVISTFAGEEVNRTLALLLKSVLGKKVEWKITPFAIRVSGFAKKEDCNAVALTLETISSLPYQQLADLLPSLPDSMWKFSSLLPSTIKKEMAISQYYKLSDVCTFLKN